MLALLRIFALGLLIVLAAFLLWVVIVNFIKRESSMWFGGRPSNLGLNDGKLRGPKKTPNSVVSEGIETSHPAYIAPIAFTGDAVAAMKTLASVVETMRDVVVIQNEDDYLYAEFRTPKMRYVDDFEARVDAAASVIHVRSASRVGKRDFDVNRGRVEAIRAKFSAN
ncbi:MAG: DUF1499 domain-containing protein [Betaproteobacteria bacterium]|nr:MAG: DUF1499 domain-containing protein [Betaproteobacteria bacterium]TAG48777.1 MAG: DUF1499 domain-containing protein [Betaproteobacteria bacterium]